MESHGSDDKRLQSLASQIQEWLRDLRQYYPKNDCMINRVPKLLRQINEEAYTPLLVSIGPLHHRDERLFPMEDHKLKYLESFLMNSDVNADDLLHSCLSIIKEKETQLRDCYAEPVDLSSDNFIKRVLVDSAFIIEFFRMMCSAQEYGFQHDMQLLLEIVLRDIKLVENQLPFSILNELYCTAFQPDANSSNDVPSFSNIACRCLCDHHYHNNFVSRSRYEHLLDLIASHSQLPNSMPINLPHSRRKDRKFAWGLDLPPATQLNAAGVKFQVIKDAVSMFDIMFYKKKGILVMPKVQLNDDTECICRNLIAFEQRKCVDISDIRYFTDYYSFLNCLVNTEEDVELLAEAGIIHNLMGSHEQASDLINSLSTHASTSIGGHYYEEISVQLKKHCENDWNRYKATLMHTYFNHPWAAISVVYAIVLLLLTIAQLVVGIIAL